MVPMGVRMLPRQQLRFWERVPGFDLCCRLVFEAFDSLPEAREEVSRQANWDSREHLRAGAQNKLGAMHVLGRDDARVYIGQHIQMMAAKVLKWAHPASPVFLFAHGEGKKEEKGTATGAESGRASAVSNDGGKGKTSSSEANASQTPSGGQCGAGGGDGEEKKRESGKPVGARAKERRERGEKAGWRLALPGISLGYPACV